MRSVALIAVACLIPGMVQAEVAGSQDTPSHRQYVPSSARNFLHPSALAAYARSRATASTACLPADIKAALALANAACGITVISTHRPGARIAGTGHQSMHATCRAADFTTKNPSCVLSALSGWRGKLSTDYGRMQHFHLDNGSYARFAHGTSRRYAKRYGKTRYAKRHHHRRYARAQ